MSAHVHDIPAVRALHELDVPLAVIERLLVYTHDTGLPLAELVRHALAVYMPGDLRELYE